MKRALASGLALLFLAGPAGAVGVAVRVNTPYPVGTPVEFAANGVGTGEVTFTWDFGDGTESEPSTSGVIMHTYDDPGHYPVIVTATDDNGSRTDSFLQAVHRPVPAVVPTSSSTIAFSRELARVCNVNADSDTVSCLSTEDLELLFEVPVGDHPRTLAFAPDGTLWVASEDDASITVLDEAGDVLDTIRLPRASKAFGIAMSPLGGRAYVSLQGTGQLVELDVEERSVLRTVDVGPWATGVAVDASGSRVFVTRFISTAQMGEVTEVGAEDFTVTRKFNLAMDPGPDSEASARGVPNYVRSVVPSPDGALIWVPSKKDNVVRGLARDGQALTFETSVRTIVSLLDPVSNEELLAERVDMNNRTLGLALTFSPLADYAFVALLGNNGVEVLDAYSRRIVGGTFELGKAPDGLVLDDQGRLYLNAFLSRTVVVLDASPVLASTGFTLEKVADVVVSTAEQLAPTVLLGKQIFYDAADTRMGKDGYISCAVCHLDGFEDGQVWDFTDRGEGLRNTTSLRGKRGIGQGRLHWSANFDEVQDFEHDIRGPFGGTGFLPDEDFESGTTNTTLGDPKAGLSPELDALSDYVTSLDRVSPSPHRDADGSLTEAGWRGLEIFRDAGCGDCHGGSDFTDSAAGVVHDVGTIAATSGQRLGGPLEGIDTPTLRGVWESAPYLHDGSAGTLLDVIAARNPDDLHGRTSELDDDELGDLAAYLSQIDNTALEDEVEPPPEDDDADDPDAEQDDGGCAVSAPGAMSQAPLAPWAVLGSLLFAFRFGARRSGRRARVGVEGRAP